MLGILNYVSFKFIFIFILIINLNCFFSQKRCLSKTYCPPYSICWVVFYAQPFFYKIQTETSQNTKLNYNFL